MDFHNKILKEFFLLELRKLASDIHKKITVNDEWTIRGFVDTFRTVYALSSDTKLVSKVLELHLFPYFMKFAQTHGFILEPAEHQNWYPDLTFILSKNPNVKFAVDLKTSYRKNETMCNGFTLGSHGDYFINRSSSKKNIQYPYNSYTAHICFGVIYNRINNDKKFEFKSYKLD